VLHLLQSLLTLLHKTVFKGKITAQGVLEHYPKISVVLSELVRNVCVCLI
jgi:hypothetical protein